jgi:putative oxidoreductase
MAETTTESTAKLSWLTVLRILLGLIIFYKAITFIRNTSALKSLIEGTGLGVFSQNSEVLAFVIAYLSLLCGLFITVGLITRVASIIQIPILIVAVFLVNIKNISYNTFEFTLSLLALILLILFAIKGSGMLSLDEYFHRGALIDKKSEKAFK